MSHPGLIACTNIDNCQSILAEGTAGISLRCWRFESSNFVTWWLWQICRALGSELACTYIALVAELLGKLGN